MQFISTAWNNGYNPVGEFVNWEELANGIDPMRRIAEAGQMEDVDPIAATNLVARTVTPQASPAIENTAPLVIEYIEASPTVQNAVLVNNLVVTNLAAPMILPQQAPSPTRASRGPTSRPTTRLRTRGWFKRSRTLSACRTC